MNTWQICEKKLEKDKIHLNETLFHTANGYLGVRGNFEEGVASGIPTTQGSYINGFYESYDIQYPEKHPGFPDSAQTVIGVTDAQGIELWLDEEKFSLFQGSLLNYERTLNMKKGMVTRIVEWESSKGKKIKVKIERLASFIQKELFAIRYSIESVNFRGNLKLRSTLLNSMPLPASDDKDVRIGRAAKLFLVTQEVVEKEKIGSIISKTDHSHLSLASSIAHLLSKKGSEKIFTKEREIAFEYVVPLQVGEHFQFEKYAVYTDSRRHKDILAENRQIIKNVISHSFAYYSQEQEKYLSNFWQHADIAIEGDDSNQSAIRFNLYQLLQSAGQDPCSSITAKGLAGPGYEGHYFWDTEIYMLPFFLFTHPEFAKKLLLFRYHTLPASRTRAQEMGHSKGALISWRTINGGECSPYFPISTAAYHINPDIAYAIMMYYEVTEDLDFLAQYGAEILFETARVMYEIGHFRVDGLFCIDTVTGPDEYSCLIDNNYYTNLMTKFHFSACQQVWNLLKTENPETLKRLMHKIRLHEDEIKGFARAADHMYLPFDERLQIHAQDDAFLQKKTWDFKNRPKENYPLILHYHPLTINRYQVCKQADTILAHMLREEETTLDRIKNGYAYYEKITTHDSSLSHCVFSIMASRIGNREKAFDYFQQTARLDLDDLHHNAYYGIHTACIGGAWMCLTYGFAGLRLIKGQLYLRPLLPKQWKRMQFTLYFKERRLLISLTHEGAMVTLLSGQPISIYINELETKLYTEGREIA